MQKECIHSRQATVRVAKDRRRRRRSFPVFSITEKKHIGVQVIFAGRHKEDPLQSVQQMTPGSLCPISKFTLVVTSYEVVIAPGFTVCSH